VTAIRTVLLMAALLGPLSLAATAAAQSVHAPAPPSASPPPLTSAPPPPPQPPFAPPSYGAPPRYLAIPIQIVALPRTLPYRENQPPPLGYSMDTRANRGMIIAGSTTLASAWGLSAIVGGIILSEGGRDSGGYGPLLVPVIGPFITLGTADDVSFDRNGEEALALLTLLNGVTQATGLALLIGGIAADQKYWLRNDIPRAASLRAPEVVIGPGGGALRFRF
jgi:hypothetical protein